MNKKNGVEIQNFMQKAKLIVKMDIPNSVYQRICISLLKNPYFDKFFGFLLILNFNYYGF